MSLMFKKLALAAASVAVILGTMAPAQAMPLLAAPVIDAASSDVTNVQYYRDYGPGPGYYGPRRGYYGPRPGYYGARPGFYGPRPNYYARPGYYSGYQGYRQHRPGYRFHQGYWFPLAAFGAGAIIGGAIAAPRYVEPAPAPVYRSTGINPRHAEWCSNRYRSYDAYSNTFQPYNGPRQSCVSPYY
ncbi:BA14K family protein [Neorhizobium lilium]|uniref:Lectin-like protein BA14k n=1 Tax=Neorhizobium lilium TaxID=2503024 RepID=A0A444LG62_9HYPH|nr:BA14K family protein [Neorhizobium lilium]RWX77187.1 BA14K family protein [Neorhizobium lilium]